MAISLSYSSDHHPIVLIVTGPCGCGKTTISSLIAENHPFIRICGDDVKEELFPGIVNIQEYPEKLTQVGAEILERAKKHFASGEHVVIDYIILAEARLEEYKRTFSDHLQIRVLLANRESIIQRDESRECWTAGEACVDQLVEGFTQLKDFIGARHYIDSTEETPEETYIKHFATWLPSKIMV